MADDNGLEATQLVKVEQLSLSSMDMQQQRMAERLYSQLGLDPVVDKVLKEYQTNLKGVDRATDRVFGPYDIKGRAESVAKIATLMTYTALHQQYSQEVEGMQQQVDDVSGQRDKERANYDSLVMKVADIVGGDYDELKSNYDEVVQRLSDVEHLKSQTSVLNQEKSELTQRYEAQLADGQRERAELTQRHEMQLAEAQKERADGVARYEAQIAAMRDEHKAAADDLRSQLAERASHIARLEGEKAAVIAERDGLQVQVAELKAYQAELESQLGALRADHAALKSAAEGIEAGTDFSELRTRLGAELHTFMMSDSKVPHAVIDGVGKFLDFKKYLGHAAEAGARDVVKQTEKKLAALK
jgi:chromosome segregation ATPase